MLKIACRRWVIVGTVAALCASTALVVPEGPGSATATGYQEYVALGDSYTAATALIPIPTTEFVPYLCAQVPNDYPHQVAAALGVPTFRDASCGGARTDHMTSPQNGIPGGGNPPQFDRLTPTTDLVTLGIGANDARIAENVLLGGGCISLLPFNIDNRCRTAINRAVASLPQVEQKIVQTIQGIRQRSPNAQIFVVNYISTFPAVGGCWPLAPLTSADATRAHNMWNELNAAVGRAAAAGGAHLVDTYTPSIGHDMCQGPSTRWVEALSPLSLNSLGVIIPFHPNSAGTNAQTAAVLAAIQGVPPLTATTTSTTTTTTTSTTVPPTTVVPTTEAATTTTSVTDPPVTGPPATAEPASTVPPTSAEPPTTEPPTTEPPTTEPPTAG